MPRHDSDAAITEPLIVPDLFITDATVERNSHNLRFVGMVRIPRINGEPEEMRIVVRLSMPVDMARRALRREVERALREGEEREN